jgi:hypothetical protein
VALRDRIKVLTTFISLCIDLFEMNNLNGVMEVLSGINSAPVRRLALTFAGVPKQKLESLKKIEDGLGFSVSFFPFLFFSFSYLSAQRCLTRTHFAITGITSTLSTRRVCLTWGCI